MDSNESDDEPLSVIAAFKKSNPEKFAQNCLKYEESGKKKNKRKSRPVISRVYKQALSPVVIERPTDVWMYLKDLKPVGPYSCLLCQDWFINRAKIIIHYVLNHQKGFCGICRYLVPDRESYWAHMKFHTPWPCSQCIENFATQGSLRHHLSSVHKLVHCRLCHFRLPDNDQYHTHLLQKHNVTDISIKDVEVPWETEYEGSATFHCLLCSKKNMMTNTFFNHYMGYHHYTLKCLTSILSGKDPPFTIKGVDVSSEFISSLKEQTRFGYVDLESHPTEKNYDSDHSINSEPSDFLKVLVPEIKQEEVSDAEGIKEEHEEDTSNKQHEALKYDGNEDFDVTLMEIIAIKKGSHDYITNILKDIDMKLIPKNSDIKYDKTDEEIVENIKCPLCESLMATTKNFIVHMHKMHWVKTVPDFSCRVCVTTFDTLTELENHIKEELGDFEDLWLCQFCDKEFDDRESTRIHLTDHWNIIDYDNCFSPHLGFKCRYCPTLFWNETDRETHQFRAHFNQHKDNFYNCGSCSDVFSDKVWYMHHYLSKHSTEDNEAPCLYKCCLCCVVVKNISDMRDHFKNSHPEARKIYCSLDSCQYRPLSHRKSLKLHLRTVHDPSTRLDQAARCPVCARDFVSARACGAHMAQVHGPGKFKCNICKEHMHTPDERKLHYLIRHPGHHPFVCRDCGKSFLYKSSLYMHRQDHAPNKQKFTCPHCSKVFMKKDSYREHIQIHEAPRHACSYCPMRFVQRSNMLRHERRHTGERPYSCSTCGRTFADKGACTSHARTHTKERSYVCVYCGQTFLQKSKLTYHIRKHTGENLESCTVCSKLFTSGCSLREHMKIHNPKTELVACPLCNKKYSDERYMLRHLRTTHSNVQYHCPLCQRAVTSAASLKHHVLTHSPLNTFRCKCCTKTAGCRRTLIKHLRKRHDIPPTEINIRDYYIRLDPRECELGLDEETLTSIFGPPKTTGLIGDFITYTETMKTSKRDKEQKKDKEAEESAEDSDQDGNDNSDGSDNESDADNQNKNDGDVDGYEVGVKLEPTDFVSVKMEPVDQEEGYE